MTAITERILLVESDPDISDLIAKQALSSLGCAVEVVTEAGNALQQALESPPDLIIADLNLPGLSGKDLLAALSARGVRAPVLVVAEKGREGDAIQAFRLGAADALFWPAREAEIVAAVERLLTQARERRARRRLDEQLKETNDELQRRVRELTSIIAIGKAVVSMTDRRALFGRIVEGALQAAGADLGWLLLRDERTNAFLLSAHKNLPEAWAKKMGQPLEDGVSALVARSGETLLIHGEPLQKFRAGALGQAAAIVPIKVREEVIGLIVAVRRAALPFGGSEQTLLEAVADYASISLVNERLFRAVQQNAGAARRGESRPAESPLSLREAARKEVDDILYPLGLMLTGKTGPFNAEQRKTLASMNAAAQRLAALMDSENPAE